MTKTHQTLADLLSSAEPSRLDARIVRARAIIAAILRIVSDSGKYPGVLTGFPDRDLRGAREADVSTWHGELHAWRSRLSLQTRLELEGENL